MFAYCLNNPISYLDNTGNCTAIANRNFCNYEPLPESCGGGAIGPIVTIGVIEWICETAESAINIFVKTGDDVKSAAKSVTKDPESQDSYTVYFLSAVNDITNKIVYVGRVRTSNFEKRLNYHASMGRKLVGFISGLDYKNCRIIEQAGMIYHHTINTLNPLYNQIRGISPRNKNLYDYMAAMADLVFTNQYPDNSLLPLSYFNNWCEEEFLALIDY